MVDFSKKARTPSFLSGGKKDKKTAGRASAANDLSAAEIYASNKPATPANSNVSTASVADAESESDSLYTGSGRPQQTKGKGKAFLKKRGPLVLILTMILGGGAAMFSGNSLLGPHLSSLITEATDTQYTTHGLRSARITGYAIDGGGQIKTTLFGNKKFKHFSHFMKKRLAKNGIEVDFDTSGKKVLKFQGKEISATEFTAKYKADPEFREAYIKAKRGRVGNFFDNMADKIFGKFGIDRNTLKNYKSTGDSETDTEAYRNKMKENMDLDSDARTGNAFKETETTTDDEGNKTTKETGKVKTEEGDSGVTNKTISGDTPEIKAKNYIDGAAKVGQVANIGCAAVKVLNSINILIAANEIYQSVHYYMTNMENVSKTMAGDGEGSAINEFLNFMTTPAASSTTDIKASAATINFSQTSDNEASGSSSAKFTSTTVASPIEASGIKLMLSQGSAQPDRSNVLNYSLDRISGAVVSTTATIMTCTAAQATAAGISLVAEAIELFTPPFGWVAFVGTVIGKTAISFAISAAIAGIIQWLVPTIAKSLFTNAFEAATGIEAGELFAKGAEAANSQLARGGSGYSPVGKKQALAFNKTTQEVLAMDAEIDRLTHSPFDITNKNTFLGSIFSKFMTLNVTSGSSNISVVSNFSNLAQTSVASLIPSTYADGENTSYQTSFGDCPTLESIGAVGDIYCNPIIASDINTLDISPENSNYQNTVGSSITTSDSGQETIKKDSDLYNYVNFCANRTSPFGSADVNILNELDGDVTTNTGLQSIPLIGDFFDIVNSTKESINMPWANGSKCVNDGSKEWNDTYRYYQRYIEDTRILDQMGVYEEAGIENPVIAAINQHAADNPLDTDPSYEGYLARISGMPKDVVIATLNVIDHYNFVATYNASDLYSFNQSDNEQELIEFNSEGKVFASLLNPIIFNDIRNRSYAA